MNTSDNIWGWNVSEKLEAVCSDVNEFVCKGPGFFVGNQMQTVGETVKKFYSDVKQEFLLSPLANPTQHIAQYAPSKDIDLVETSNTSVVAVKEDVVNHSEEVTEDGNLINNISGNTIQGNNVVEQFPCQDEKRADDHSAKILCESSESRLNDRAKQEDIFSDTSSESDDAGCEDGCETDTIESLMNLKEKCDDDPSAKISCESSGSKLDDIITHDDILRNASSQSDDSEFEDCWSMTDIADDISKDEVILSSAASQSDDSESEDGWGEGDDIELNLGIEESIEVDSLINLKEKCDDDGDDSIKMSLEFSENHLEETNKQLCDAISQSDAFECEDGWGETDIIGLNLDTEEKVELDSLGDTSAFENGCGIPDMINLDSMPEENIEAEPPMNLKEKCDDDQSANMSCEFTENHFEDVFKQEGILSDASSQSDASKFEDDSGIKNVIDMNLGPEEKIEVEPLLSDLNLMPEENIDVEPSMKLKEKCVDDNFANMSCEFSENHFEDVFKQEGILSDASLQSNASEFEDDSGIKNVIDMNLGPEEKIEVEPLLSDVLAFKDSDRSITNIIDLNLDTEENIESGLLGDTSAVEDGWGIPDMIDLNLMPEENLEVEPLMNLNEKCDDNHSANMSCEFSENHFEDVFEQEGILSDASSQSDASEFEDNSGIKNVIHMTLGLEEKIEVEPLLSDLNLMPEENIEVEPPMKLKEKCVDDNFANMSCEFSEDHFKDVFKQKGGIVSGASSQCDALEFEDDSGIKNVIDMNLGPEEKITVEPLLSDALAFTDSNCSITNIIDLNLDTEDNKVEALMNLEEKEILLNCSVNEFDCDSSAHQTSELENSVTCNENKEESSCQTESVGDFSVSSFGLSSCDINSLSEIGIPYGSSAVSFEDVDMGTTDMSNEKKFVEIAAIAVGRKSIDFPSKAGKCKSYKKIIQDVFMSRKRIAKEYKRLAILYGDIDTESTEENESSNIVTTDLPDSEWELL